MVQWEVLADFVYSLIITRLRRVVVYEDNAIFPGLRKTCDVKIYQPPWWTESPVLIPIFLRKCKKGQIPLNWNCPLRFKSTKCVCYHKLKISIIMSTAWHQIYFLALFQSLVPFLKGILEIDEISKIILRS